MTHAADPLPPAIPPLVEPAELPNWVLLNDERLLVIDKPGWLVVHPSKNGPWSSLAGAVREGLGLETIRFIYRLDRETSGVIVLRKDENTGSRLQKAMGKRLIGKAYVTILEGELRRTDHRGPVAWARPVGGRYRQAARRPGGFTGQSIGENNFPPAGGARRLHAAGGSRTARRAANTRSEPMRNSSATGWRATNYTDPIRGCTWNSPCTGGLSGTRRCWRSRARRCIAPRSTCGRRGWTMCCVHRGRRTWRGSRRAR